MLFNKLRAYVTKLLHFPILFLSHVWKYGYTFECCRRTNTISSVLVDVYFRKLLHGTRIK